MSPNLDSALNDKTVEMRGRQGEVEQMLHILSFTPGRFLCGAVDNALDEPVQFATDDVAFDCVVCVELSRAMPKQQAKALAIFWGYEA